MPAVIDTCLSVADELDFQVQIHTDTLNESGFLEDTLAAINGRTIHMYHTGAPAAAMRPDIIRVAGEPNCLPSSTNPTNPFTVNTFDEHLDMMMVCHHLNPAVPEDVAFAESRIRAADHGRRGHPPRHRRHLDARLGQPGHGTHRRGDLPHLAACLEDEGPARPPARAKRPAIGDNERIKRYIAKYTINAARTFGIDDHVGSLEPGKMADIVMWRPAFFGIKPELVIKGGFIAWGAMGDSAASLMTCEPLLHAAAVGRVRAAPSRRFGLLREPAGDRCGLAGTSICGRLLLPARGNPQAQQAAHAAQRRLSATSRVDPQTFDVFVDGELATCEPARELPLGQRYMLR